MPARHEQVGAAASVGVATVPLSRSLAAASAWFAVYLALILAPVAALLLGPTPPGLGFWWDLSMALGFAGLAMMAVQFVLTARFRRATAPFGIDIIYYFHRYLGVVALVIVVAHPAIALVDKPAISGFLDPRSAPWHMTAGVISVVALVALVLVSFARRQWRIPYENWRTTHVLLSVSTVGLAFAHIHGVQYYVATPLITAWWQAVVVSCLGIVLFVRVIRPWQLRRRPYRVVSVTPERGDAWTLAVEPERAGTMAFQPGQFAWLTLGISPFAMKEHPFSFSSSPGLPKGRLEFTVKELGDFTRTIGETPVGTRAFVDGPYGAFTIDRHPAARYVFISGGIGIAPVLGMLKAMADRHDSRPVLLLYAYSQWDRMTCRDVIESLRERLTLTVVYVVEQPTADWPGERGWITDDVLARHLPEGHREAEYFVCGPQAMTRAMEQLLHGLGVPLSRVHSELFELV